MCMSSVSAQIVISLILNMRLWFSTGRCLVALIFAFVFLLTWIMAFFVQLINHSTTPFFPAQNRSEFAAALNRDINIIGFCYVWSMSQFQGDSSLSPNHSPLLIEKNLFIFRMLNKKNSGVSHLIHNWLLRNSFYAFCQVLQR